MDRFKLIVQAMEGDIWQPVAPLTGWLSSDADVMRLQRVFRQVSERLANARCIARALTRAARAPRRPPASR
jgi:hypothetical protein